MREIEFRAKVLGENEWVYGYPFPICQSNGTLTWMITVIEREPLSEGGYVYEERDYYIDPDTIGQYTGLRDKNGVKIFEGDVMPLKAKVEVERRKDASYSETDSDGIRTYYNIDPKPCVVAFEDGSFVGVYSSGSRETIFFLSNSNEYEIIGNIHDNPELINE